MNHYLLAAYGIMWLILFGYVFSIGRRQLRLQQELARLREALENAGSPLLVPSERSRK